MKRAGIKLDEGFQRFFRGLLISKLKEVADKSGNYKSVKLSNNGKMIIIRTDDDSNITLTVPIAFEISDEELENVNKSN